MEENTDSKTENSKTENDAAGTESSAEGFGPQAEAAAPDDAEQLARTGILGFILVPALLVLVIVGIIYGVQRLAVDQRTYQDYVRLLDSPDKSVRWQAVLDLMQSGRPQPELADLLIEIVEAPPEEQQFVQESWSPSDILKTPEEKEVSLRWYAAAALGTVGGERAFQKLLELTEDPDDGVRLYAVQALGRMRDARAVPALTEALRGDEDWGVRTAAAFALGEIGDPDAAPALKTAFAEDPNEDVRWHAAIALARLGDDAGRALLEERTRSDEAAIRVQSRKALQLLD